MRALDQRLVRRARPVRRLLAFDVVLGLVGALLVLVQATLLARIVAAAFSGASLHEVSRDLVLLTLAFAGRGALAWGFELAGRRAAASVLSKLRLAVVERRLRNDPSALDGVEAGEIAASAVQGVDGLEAYFARYLPQLVLAAIVPLAVLGWVAATDAVTAAVMVVTLPLVPVFMWLIGRYTEERTRERWHALSALSGRFLDVVRGLPTLQAFNAARSQAQALEDVGERYRRTTMATLRVGFLSGSVLELAATLGVALVAVTVGVRLTDGSLGLQAGLTVLVLAPELYLPLRQLAAQFHASADGLAVAERMLELLDRPAAVGTGGRLVPPSPHAAAVRFEAVSFAYPSRPAPVLDRFELELLPGETVALVGPSGAGKTTAARLLLLLAEPTGGRV
ncbi:MAG TPA: ABC transporter transmembrane domain-containing protein, partial [Gaiellaceae bacterium]|nr:ABC transporter transmembrane domain-containing protein [Gaiellaceae bacterium]